MKPAKPPESNSASSTKPHHCQASPHIPMCESIQMWEQACPRYRPKVHHPDSLAFIPDPPEAIRLQEPPMNLEHLTERLHRIRDTNNWKQFHSPKNLAMAASVEMAELVEIFQWLTEDQSRQLPADTLAHAGQEVGDIVLYLLLLCSELGLDMNEVVRAKLADSERRFAHE